MNLRSGWWNETVRTDNFPLLLKRSGGALPTWRDVISPPDTLGPTKPMTCFVTTNASGTISNLLDPRRMDICPPAPRRHAPLLFHGFYPVPPSLVRSP